MPRTAVIEQPNYIPWIGYFDLVRQSDVWIWYDDVQYTKRDWRNRNRIAAGDSAEWLTIPVKTRGRFHQRICDVEIDDATPWRRAHLENLRRCYARAPHFDTMFALMQRALNAGDTHLADLTIRLAEEICAELGIKREFERSSARRRPAGWPGGVSPPNANLIDLCQAANADVYLSGPSARAYIDPGAFAAAGIELRYIVYDYPPYPRGPHPWVPNLSIVDALAWLGAEATAAYLAAHSRSEAEVPA